MATKTKAATSAERKASLLEAGAKLAAKHGEKNVTRRMVAKAAGVTESLVSHYMGQGAAAQKAYARKAKALGLTLPTKAESEVKGARLRAHGPRAKTVQRKRTVKEVKAIKEKAKRPAAAKAGAAKKSATKRAVASTATARTTSRAAKSASAVKSAPLSAAPKSTKRSAARAPLPAPVAPAQADPLPLPSLSLPLPLPQV